ncbi:MAG: hypothetical protein FH758_10775 [Firmicutes bacterium]|nr:hypothetical protein [Bacillota bacterium]
MEVIEQGQIKLRSDFKQYPYIIRLLKKSDLTAVLQLQSNVLAKVKKKDCCVPLAAEELLLMLNGSGESIGLFVENQLYAKCSLLYPVGYENNMARELDFSDEELKLVSQLELSLVHSDLRGHKLQQKLAGILARRAEAAKKARYLFTTVSPYNFPSIQTVTSLGLQIAKLCKMYYGWDRYVVYKDFTNPVALDIENAVSLPSTAQEKQQHLLNNGYRGFSQFKDQDGIKIMYAKMRDYYEKCISG